MPSPIRTFSETLRRPQNGGNNILITRAAAQVAAQSLAYLVFRRRKIFVEKLIEGHEKTGRAKAALKTQRFQKALLERMKQVAIFGLRRQSLDRKDRCTVRLHGEEQTRTDGLAVKQYSAA